MKVKFEIKNWAGAVLFTYESETLRQTVEAAVLSRADLSGADLSGADLSGANLSGAHLLGADLFGANLSRADLSGADLSGADLSGANLSRADLSRAHLLGADLFGANLSRAHLSGADLSGADLSGANLSRADLKDAKGAECALAQTTHVPESGPFWGWKKCRNGVLVKVAIGAKAKRSNGAGRKCRAEYVKVIEVVGGEFGLSLHDGTTEYRLGEIVKCDKWNEDRWTECGGGIHFFLTRTEAEAFQM